MHILQPNISDIDEVSSVFDTFLEEIRRYYSHEEILEFLSYHTPHELQDKFTDPKRFFRIVRNDHGEIVAYFESRNDKTKPEMQRIQWFFVHPHYRTKGILKAILKDFEDWCQKNGYTIIWSICSLENIISMRVHIVLGFEKYDTPFSGKQEFIKTLK